MAAAIQGVTYRLTPLADATDLFIRVGDLERARETVKLIGYPVFAIESLRQLARAEARQGNQASARTLWTEALNLVKENHKSYVGIEEIQAEMGDLSGALKTVATISTEDKKQDALCRVAAGAGEPWATAEKPPR